VFCVIGMDFCWSRACVSITKVAISCLRSWIKDDMSIGGWCWFGYGCWDVEDSISIALGSGSDQMDAISVLICSTVRVNRVRSSWILFLSDCRSVTELVVIALVEVELLLLDGELFVLLEDAVASVVDWDSV